MFQFYRVLLQLSEFQWIGTAKYLDMCKQPQGEPLDGKLGQCTWLYILTLRKAHDTLEDGSWPCNMSALQLLGCNPSLLYATLCEPWVQDHEQLNSRKCSLFLRMHSWVVKAFSHRRVQTGSKNISYFTIMEKTNIRHSQLQLVRGLTWFEAYFVIRPST